MYESSCAGAVRVADRGGPKGMDGSRPFDLRNDHRLTSICDPSELSVAGQVFKGQDCNPLDGPMRRPGTRGQKQNSGDRDRIRTLQSGLGSCAMIFLNSSSSRNGSNSASFMNFSRSLKPSSSAF